MPLRQLAAFALLGCLTATSTSCGRDVEEDADNLVGALAGMRLPRSIAAQLSIPTAYARCDSAAAGACPHQPPSDGALLARVATIGARAVDRLHERYDPDAVHAAALIDLLWGDTTGNSLRRTISSLRLAAQVSTHPAPLLTDLAAALLVRAARIGSAADVVEAIDAAQHAVELDSVNPAARFDLALALDRLGLSAQAGQSWRDYVRVDATSPWAGEARAGARRCDRIAVPATDSMSVSPQALRVVGWDSVLGAWGAAVLRGDSTRADALLRRAHQLAAIVPHTGDSSLADAERDIRASSGPRRRALAGEYDAYGQGRRDFLAGDLVGARRSLTTAAHARSYALNAWASTYLSAAALQLGDTATARRLIPRVDTSRYPALAGQSHWTRAVVLMRVGDYEKGLAESRLAEQCFIRAGERENQGAVEFLQASAYVALGSYTTTVQWLSRALVTLQPDRRSVFLHNVLLVWAEVASNGPVRAAMRLEDEDIAVASLSRLPVETVGARTLRARLRAATGDTTGAIRDLDSARTLLGAVPPGPIYRWLQSNVALAQASLTPKRNVDALLDSAVRFFHEIHSVALEPQALAMRADARLMRGDTVGGAGDLRRALAFLATGNALSNTPLRVALLDAARRSIDRLVLLRAGDPREALVVLEDGRASITRNAHAAMRVPSGVAVVDYAVIGDTMLTWTVRDTLVRLHRQTIRRDTLFGTIARVVAAMEAHIPEPHIARDLAQLYRDLMAPVEADIPSSDTSLVIIADGEMAAVPFAALRDRRGRYVVESRLLRFSNSLRDALSPRGIARVAASTPVLVGDPAFAPSLHPDLARLPGARVEVDSIHAIYPTARVLLGTAADRHAVAAALGSATVVHFAGHARVDDDEPERSGLVLAGAAPSADLDAASIASLHLSGAPLVVLSACETAVARAGRSGGLASLTGAFLQAGARGVVGSLWRVDDGDTQPFMILLHRAYTQSGDGAVALRGAQLQVLHRSMAWAAFRYTGS
jgi:CHAT domain-containing protein/tetratricopeptide (TPR) repeat protein